MTTIRTRLSLFRGGYIGRPHFLLILPFFVADFRLFVYCSSFIVYRFLFFFAFSVFTVYRARLTKETRAGHLLSHLLVPF
jgi:hypothetical protein